MRRRLGIWLWVGLNTLGCATSGGLQSGVYRGTETTYRIASPPADWTPVAVDDQNDLAWHSQLRSGVIHVDSSCDPALDIPLTALRSHLLIGFTEREVVEEEVVAMDEREALRTHLRAKLDGVPREILVQILKKDGCVYDFGLVTPPGPTFEAAASDFDALLASFTTDAGRS